MGKMSTSTRYRILTTVATLALVAVCEVATCGEPYAWGEHVPLWLVAAFSVFLTWWL